MFCIFCGTRLPLIARFCRECGRAVYDEAADEPAPALPESQAVAPRAQSHGRASQTEVSPIALGATRQTLPSGQLGQLAQWPEHFVHEILTLVPALSAEEQLRLERACRAHVDAVLEGPGDVDLDDLERRLESNRPGGAIATRRNRAGSSPGDDPD